MAVMEYKQAPSSARKFKVLEAMDRLFQQLDRSPHCLEDILHVRDETIIALSPFYGNRAVRTTYNAICREKGWEIKNNKAPKPDKNGLGLRMDQIDERVSISEGTIIELSKRIGALEANSIRGD